MKLFYSPFHDFAHKALVVAHEAGLWDKVTLVPTFPFRNLNSEFVTGQYDLSEIAPLNKVPCLALENGQVLYSSQTVIEYLDANRISGERLYPAEGPARWDALSRLAMGDALFEFAVQVSMEDWLDEGERRKSLYEWLWPKMILCLDEFERHISADMPFDIGHAGMLQGISYFEAKFTDNPGDPIHPDYDWRDGRERLVAWYDDVIKRPSVQTHHKQAYDGDLSPENHQRHVREVLAARKAQGAQR